MTDSSKFTRILLKLIATVSSFKKTAYHHYGANPLSLLKFIYYSAMRINTFYVFEFDLRNELPSNDFNLDFHMIKPSLDELKKIREGTELPREFYYDRIFNAKYCYLLFRNCELAGIYWVLRKGDYSRFLILPEGAAELNYNTVLKKFRGKQLMEKQIIYISKELQKDGYKKVMGVIHESNPPALKAIEKAGFKRITKIRAWGPFNGKLQV